MVCLHLLDAVKQSIMCFPLHNHTQIKTWEFLASNKVWMGGKLLGCLFKIFTYLLVF